MPDTEELKAVNSAVRKYATEGDDEYENRDLIDALYSLHDNINREVFGGRLDPPVISVDTEGHTQKDGYYGFMRNEAGLSHNIRISVGTSGVALVNALLHQTIHQFRAQQTDDASAGQHSWYHDNAFKSQMLNLGITVNDKGDVTGMTPFYAETLKKLQLDFLVDEELKETKEGEEGEEGYKAPPPREIKQKGSGRMKAYVCDCTGDNKGYFTNDSTPIKWMCQTCGSTPHQA